MNKLNVFGRLRAALTKKNLLVAAVFVTALAGAISLGHASKQVTYAADCSNNAVLKCGVANPNEFIDRVARNDQDTQGIYNLSGLQPEEYARFRTEAKHGIAYKDGTIKVDGVTVATNSWSIGRDQKAKSWNWHGFWADYAWDVFTRNEIPVMVLFNDKGEMDFAVMYDCGNSAGGDVIRNNFECKNLVPTPVAGKKDTYSFQVEAPYSGNVSIAKVVYNFGDGTTETRTDLNPIEHKFTKPGNYTVTVSVTFNLPGGKQKTVEGVHCKTLITVKEPFYVCEMLKATALNDKKTQFRFTVNAKYGNGATLKDADFTLDGNNTTTGVVTKDAQGNIYKDYTFAEDGKSHKVVAKVNFNLEDAVTSKTCEATVTSTKAPVCEVPGKEMYPPNAPECGYCDIPSKAHLKLPKDSPDCKETPVTPAPELPKTGMGNLVGIFAGTSALGAVAHRVISSRRRS